MSIKDRLIQFVLRGKDELSPAARKSAEAMEALKQEADSLGKALDDAKGAQGLAKGLDATRRAVAQAETGLRQTEQQVVDLREALNKTPDAAGIQQSLKQAERDAARARKQLNGLQAELKDVEKASAAAGIDTRDLSNEQQRLANEVTKAKAALTANTTEVKALEREQAKASRTTAEHTSKVAAAREGMTSGAQRVLAFAAAYISLNVAFGLVQKGLNLVSTGIKSMLTTGDQFELLDKRMASLMGSIAGGEQATAWIRQFAKDTPLEVADVSEAFALLKSYGLDPMGGALQAIVDKNEQLGGGMERLQGISSALGQAYAKQKLQTEEILQLVERGVPVWTLLEKVTGKNAAQLADLATQGKLGRDVIKALIDEMGRSAEGAAAENMGTLTGLVSNLSDVWSGFLDRVSKSGALDYAKAQLQKVADTIDEMDRDGRLDALATSLSNAFVQGAEKVKELVAELVKVDFKTLADDSAKWLNNFGTHIDETTTKLQLFAAPFRTLFNGLTAGLSGFAAMVTNKMSEVLAIVGRVAEALPERLGGAKLRAAVAESRAVLDGLTAGFMEQINQDGADIAAAWDTTTKSVAAAAKEQTEVVKQEADDQFQHVVQRVSDMNNALAQIDAAEGAAQLKKLGDEMLAAFRRGDLSQQEFAAGSQLLNARLKDIGGAAGGAAFDVSKLDDALGDLAKVQAAISSAKTDVDINKINAALRKLYDGGKITAEQYNAEIQKSADRQKELKQAVNDGAKAQAEKNKADKEAIVTSEQLRRESGKRMEAERKAGDQAMQDRRKGSEEAKRDMGDMEGFFGGVVSRAREPLAAMSAAALEAFDRLRGISSVDMSIDTSSLDATRESAERVSRSLGDVQLALSSPMLGSLGRWQLENQQQSLQTQLAYLSQKSSLQSLMDKYAEGTLTTRQFIAAAKGARSAVGLLDDSDLSSLNSAIKSAEQSMAAMADSTRSTLEGLQDELDQLEGRTADIERRKFAARQRDLQAQLADAQANGDNQAVANASRALGMLRQIESASAQQRQADEQKKRQEEIAKAVTDQSPAAQSAPAKIIRLETAQGKTVDVALQNDADETNLLSILEDAGLRAL